ncbi:MAG: hypothetical protein B7Y39_17210 [Bdellovibrio sp. 28-41-41]|nr:MAG: hypothetical protein B7Y39_17210 [Bdellovibrio sp. 28-41-41]
MKKSGVLVFLLIGINFVGLSSAHAISCESFYKESTVTAVSSPLSFNTPVVWNNSVLWNKSMTHSNDFFIRYGWDKDSKSFASDISSDGKVLSDKRYIISTSRMIYGLAHSAENNPSFLNLAKQQAQFLLGKMTAQDQNGLYFKATVDAKGNLVAPENQLVVNYQACKAPEVFILSSK